MFKVKKEALLIQNHSQERKKERKGGRKEKEGREGEGREGNLFYLMLINNSEKNWLNIVHGQ